MTGGRITGLIHMPPRAQKILSRPVNAMLAKRVRAQLVGDTSMGARERRERAEETCAKQAGEALQAHPWQDSDTLSLASHEMLVSMVWRYCLDAPVGLQPGRECGHKTCGYCGPALPALRDTEQRIQLAHGARREWLEHTVRGCAWSRGVQRLCHDAVLKVLKLMMESAGFEDVVMEDRWWDEGDDEAKDTRRPDITAFNPRIRRRVVIDVVGAWAMQAGGSKDGRWREPGHSANVKALGKWRSYKGARRRQEEGGMGWLVKGKGTAADVFVPFAFEVGGALGSEAEAFLRECTAVAEWKNQGVGDLAHWSSMTWGGHWRQRIGVEIARGVARCVERAATGGWASSGTGRGCSHEYDPDCG